MSEVAGWPVLVFAHAFGGSARSWAALVEVLGASWICETPSLHGFGGTPAPEGGPSLDAYADQLCALAGGRPWIVVGHSMGGKIALWLAARRPAGLRGMVLIAASPLAQPGEKPVLPFKVMRFEPGPNASG